MAGGGSVAAVDVAVAVVVGGLRSISLWTSSFIEFSVGYPSDTVSARRTTSADTETLILSLPKSHWSTSPPALLLYEPHVAL